MGSYPFIITKVGTLPLSGAASAGGRAVGRSLCVQAVGLSSLAALISNKSALEVCTRRCAIQNAFTFTFTY